MMQKLRMIIKFYGPMTPEELTEKMYCDDDVHPNQVSVVKSAVSDDPELYQDDTGRVHVGANA